MQCAPRRSSSLAALRTSTSPSQTAPRPLHVACRLAQASRSRGSGWGLRVCAARRPHRRLPPGRCTAQLRSESAIQRVIAEAFKPARRLTFPSQTAPALCAWARGSHSRGLGVRGAGVQGPWRWWRRSAGAVLRQRRPQCRLQPQHGTACILCRKKKHRSWRQHGWLPSLRHLQALADRANPAVCKAQRRGSSVQGRPEGSATGCAVLPPPPHVCVPPGLAQRVAHEQQPGAHDEALVDCLGQPKVGASCAHDLESRVSG